tara:strand:- start:572 stop:1642 length:1071 start_codon:yes stop_codon:yes gene_type:complete
MKQGLALPQLAAQLEENALWNKDYLASTNILTAYPEGNGSISLAGIFGSVPGNKGNLHNLSHHALRQIGAHQNIPAKYMDRMVKDAPELLCSNINHWFAKEPSKRLFRTNREGVRAVLSNRYRIIDNDDVASMTLPILMAMPELEIISCQVTDKKLYIKAVTPKVQGEVVVGQAVQAGVIITNSEIGMGSLSISPFAYFLWCLNGCSTGKGLAKYHVGRAAGDSEDIQEVIGDDTKEAEDKALMLRMRDALHASFDAVEFDKSLNKFREAKNIKVVDPVGSIEQIEKRGWISQQEGKSILAHLIEGGDTSVFGISSAVTRFSQDVESYDRASDLENLGGAIIELPRKEWQTIAQAA